MTAIAQIVDQIVELDVERDRKTCIALSLKATGANRELAQWIFDHPEYSQRVIGEWIGCHHTRVFYLRKWAREGFVGNPFDKGNKPDNRGNRHSAGPARDQESLESLDNSDLEGIESQSIEDSEVADPSTIEDNALYTIQRINEHARVFKKLFKISSLDREARHRIRTAIERMIQKWRSTQATLERKGSDDDKA